MLKTRVIALMLLIAGAGVGWFVYSSEMAQESNYKFKLGLDLSGGTQLLYKADTTSLPEQDRKSSMQALRDTLERRVNVFGVAEPLVQTQKSGGEDRVIVELPGVTDTQKAIDMLGKTPVLEFKLQRTLDAETDSGPTKINVWESTGLTGKYLKRATVQFDSGGGGLQEPVVSLQFNSEGAKLFAKITKENKGEILGIFLDGSPISTPVINDEIPNGTAIVSGNFSAEQARELVRNLNYGALPVSIELLSAQTIGASLGADAVERGIVAGVWGLAFVALFLILWYRLPGLIAVVSLSIYIATMLAIFKLLPVTLTAAGIAGFILSIGLAVDANVLIFERLKEELREQGAWAHNAMQVAFKRAWLSIRDGNLSSIITAVILFWFGTSLVKGFALVFGIGVIVSMLTAIAVTRIFLLAIGDFENKGWIKRLFSNGFKL